jgi:hypothetical protein
MILRKGPCGKKTRIESITDFLERNKPVTEQGDLPSFSFLCIIITFYDRFVILELYDGFNLSKLCSISVRPTGRREGSYHLSVANGANSQ